MASQFVPLLRNEIAKAMRRKLPWFGILAVALVSVITYFVAGQMSTAATSNGWGYVGFSMQIIFSDIGSSFITIYAALLLSEETGTGTVRALLAAPVHRWELYLAKGASGVLYMLLLSVAALIFSALLACVHYKFSPVGDSFGTIYSSSQALRTLATAWAISWIPLAALVTYGVLISTLIRNTGAAVAVALTSMLLIDFTKHLVGIDPYVFTRYINFPWLGLQQIAQGMDYQWTPELWRLMELCLISAGVMFTAGLVIFVKQDLNK